MKTLYRNNLKILSSFIFLLMFSNVKAQSSADIQPQNSLEQRVNAIIETLTNHSTAELLLTMQIENSPSSSQEYSTVVTQSFKQCLESIISFNEQLDNFKLLTSYKDLLISLISYSFLDDAKKINLNGDDYIVLGAYTSDYYIPINHNLWEIHKFSKPSTSQIQNLKTHQCFIDQLNKTLQKFPNYQGVTIRGLNIPKEKLPLYKSHHSKIPFYGFTSTTAGEEISQYFRDQPHYLKIYTKHGKNISAYSFLDGEENEVLLPANSFFEVCKSEPILVDGFKKWLFTLVEIDEADYKSKVSTKSQCSGF